MAEELVNQEEQQQAAPQGNERTYSYVAYLGILWFFVRFCVKTRGEFLNFHLKQGGIVMVFFMIGILGYKLSTFDTFGSSIFAIIGLAANVIAIMGCIVGLINVSGGKMKKVPLIGNLGEKYVKI